jgi:hypothetical protein
MTSVAAMGAPLLLSIVMVPLALAGSVVLGVAVASGLWH